MKIDPAAPVDLSHFDNDPVAQKTQWIPLNDGGSNFKTYKLSNDAANRMSFKASTATKIFCMVFALIGIAIPVVIIMTNMKEGMASLNSANIFITAMGLLFTTVGVSLLYSFNKPIVFDKTEGYFWKGRKTPKRHSDQNPKSAVLISDIHAFQLIAEHVKRNDRSFYSYELNLILKDGSRHNVIDHGNIDELRKDADKLSKFMNKPVWDSAG